LIVLVQYFFETLKRTSTLGFRRKTGYIEINGQLKRLS